MKYALWTVFAAAAIWLLLLWRSFRQHAKRNAAQAAAPIVPTSTTSTVVPSAAPPAPTTAVPAAAPAAVATMAPPVAAATTTTPPPAGPIPSLPQEPWFWKWFIRIGVVTVALTLSAATIWFIAYLSPKIGDLAGGLWTATKAVLASNLYWVLGIVAVVLVGWIVWRTWFKPSATATITPAGTTTAAAGTATTATPTAAEIKAAADAEFKQKVELAKIQLQKSSARRSWFWKLSTVGILAFGIWAIWIRPQANGLTPSQEVVASAGVSTAPPKVSYTFAAYKSGSNEEIRCRAWVLNEVRGDYPHMWFSVERFMQGRPVVVLYKWDGRKKAGTWEDEGDGTRGEFTGDLDPRDPSRFAGEIFAEGTTFRYFLQKKDGQ